MSASRLPLASTLASMASGLLQAYGPATLLSSCGLRVGKSHSSKALPSSFSVAAAERYATRICSGSSFGLSTISIRVELTRKKLYMPGTLTFCSMALAKAGPPRAALAPSPPVSSTMASLRGSANGSECTKARPLQRS